MAIQVYNECTARPLPPVDCESNSSKPNVFAMFSQSEIISVSLRMTCRTNFWFFKSKCFQACFGWRGSREHSRPINLNGMWWNLLKFYKGCELERCGSSRNKASVLRASGQSKGRRVFLIATTGRTHRLFAQQYNVVLHEYIGMGLALHEAGD